MKAIVYHRYGGPEVLEVAEVPQPAPGDNEVLIQVHAVAVTSADCAIRKGEPFIARLFAGLTKPKQPILGTEFAGEIVSVGKSVTRFRPGDAVYAATGGGFGAHAEYVCLPEDGALALKPAGATYAEAAAICEGVLTALPFLRDKGGIQQGHKVLINGASGSVGTDAVQIAKHLGAEVTGVCSAKNVDLVKSLGADHVIDYTQQDFTRNGQTYDIIFDAVAKSSFGRCKGSLTPHGIYLTTVPSLGLMLPMLWTSRFGGKKAVVTFTGLRPPAEKRADLEFLKGLVEAGTVKPVIERCYALHEAMEAHRHVDTGHKRGHVVITIVPEASA